MVIKILVPSSFGEEEKRLQEKTTTTAKKNHRIQTSEKFRLFFGSEVKHELLEFPFKVGVCQGLS